jgi:hypothetical protein
MSESNPGGPAARGNARVVESAGSIAFADRNLQPSSHPALQGGNAGGAVDPVAAVTQLVNSLAPNRIR